jgi:hypothetical protein
MTPNDFLKNLRADQDNFYVAVKGDQAHKIRGSFARVRPRLDALNSVGYEIFYSVNAHQPGAPSKSSEFVSEYRAHFADVDQIGAPAPVNLPPPSMVVESSPGKRQYIWLLEYSYPEWPAVQEWLVSQVPGADPVAKDPARVLRLPGFLNHKYDPPHLVKVLHETPARYNPQAFLELAPKIVPVPAAKLAPRGNPAALASFLKTATVPPPGSGARNPWVFRAAAWGVRDLHLDPETVAEMIHDKLEREQGHLAYDFSRVQQIVKNAARFGRSVRAFSVQPEVELE